MDKKSKQILERKAELILQEHARTFDSYSLAYIVDSRYSHTNTTKVLHKMEFSVVIVSEGKEYRADEMVVNNPYVIKDVGLIIDSVDELNESN